MALTALKNANLALAFLLELGTLAALCYWGFVTGPNIGLKLLLGLGAPILATIIWAIFGAPKSTKHLTGIAYVVLRVVFFGSAAVALVAAGQRELGIAFALVTLINTAGLVVWRQQTA